MINLLTETVEALWAHDKTEDDVLWCSVGDEYFTWAEFKISANYAYDNGYGYDVVRSSLLVVCKDFWLEREEYHGSEWWELKRTPEKPLVYTNKPILFHNRNAQD